MPLNIFGGPGTITDEMLAYIQPVVRDRSKQTLDVFTANVSGDIAELWAGPLSVAAGLEHPNILRVYDVGGGEFHRAIKISRDGKHAYVPNALDDTVSVFDVESGEVRFFEQRFKDVPTNDAD